MPSPQTHSAELVRGQLERVLTSQGFVRNDRLSGFLRYVIEQDLSGRGDELKESVIGVEVFGRRPGYDVRQDSAVRTEAAKLRSRLLAYYSGEGAADPLIIELPKGGYRPHVTSNPVLTLPAAPLAPRPGPSRRVWLAAGLTCLSLGVAALTWWALKHRNAPVTIAVLPLVNMSQDPANDYFCDGLSGEIIRNLSILEGLAVRSQTSSFVFKGKPRNIRDAGKQLDAEYILEGSVLRSGQQLRIIAQLVRVHDDFPLWSAKYDRELTDVFAIQDEISRGIVNSLRLKLGRGRRRYETSTDAYDLYLRARAVEARGLAKGAPERLAAFGEAIARDPSFAPAWSGLASTYAMASGFDRFDPVERADLVSKMRAAAEKAIQLDPLLAEAHGAMAMAYARDARWEESGRSFRRALELDPASSLLRTQYVINTLLPLGRIEEAVAQVHTAQKSDPLSRAVGEVADITLRAAGRFDEADARCPKPCIEALLHQGRAAEAIPILEARFAADLTGPSTGTLGRAYALAGRRGDAERIARLQWRPIEQAGIFMALGDKDRAIEALERAVPLGAVRLGRDLAYHQFATIRGDPRVKALRRQISLPE